MGVALFANERARAAAIVSPLWQQSHDEPQTGQSAGSRPRRTRRRRRARCSTAAEDWLGRRGMTRAIAPFNGNAFLGMAVSTAAFDERPDVPDAVDAAVLRAVPRGRRVCARAIRSGSTRSTSPPSATATSRGARWTSPECTVREIDKRRWDEEVETLRLIWNEGFSDEWEFQQYTRAAVPGVLQGREAHRRPAHRPDRRGGRRAGRARAGHARPQPGVPRDARPARADQAAPPDAGRAPAEPGRTAGDRGAPAVSRAADRRHARIGALPQPRGRWDCGRAPTTR